MAEKSRFRDFLALAIQQEREATQLYERNAARTESRTGRALLESMAAMERQHEAKLEELQQTGSTRFPAEQDVPDLHIGDFLVEGVLTPESTLQDVYVFAIRAEQKAYDLYRRLAELEGTGTVHDLFLALAAEEKKHKHDLETEYESQFMTED
jgi:rubrerythrin